MDSVLTFWFVFFPPAQVFGGSSFTCLVPALSGLNVTFILTMLLPVALLGVVILCVKFSLQQRLHVGVSLYSKGVEETVKSVAEEKLAMYGAVDETSSDGTNELDSEAVKSLMLPIIFLIYPTLVNTIFKMLSCRKLGEDESVNRYDYSIDCESGSHYVMELLAWLFMAFYGIGIPAMYMRELWAARHELQLPEAEPQPELSPEAEHLIEGSEADLSGDTPVSVAKEKFKFLAGSYTPECYWFEIAEFARKFVLTGALALIGQPGSPGQTFVGLVLSFFYQMLVANKLPLKEAKQNTLKICAETQVFPTPLVFSFKTRSYSA